MTVDYSRRHLRFGWWSLLLFTILGLALESLHGLKAPFYLDVSNSTRRLMWTLAHAHGALLALVHVLFGLTVRVAPELFAHRLRLTSWLLVAASVTLPGGFFLGGLVVYGGDPGIGIGVVPLGAAALVIALFWLARAADAPVRREPHPAIPLRQIATKSVGRRQHN